jgi:hypothetical protein
MEYKSLTKAERDLAIAEAIHSREVEHFHYELNATNYQDLLASLAAVPDQWPENLQYLRGYSRDEIIKAAKTESDASAALAIMEKIRLTHLLKSESHELAKVALYHSQLLSHFKDEEELATALTAARTKREAAEDARLNRPPTTGND